MRLIDCTFGGVSFHPSHYTSLVVEVKQGQHFDAVFIELKDSELININESFLFWR